MTSSLWAAGRYEAVAEQIAGIAAEVVAAVEERIPLHGTAVVDLACGTGSAALIAASRGARVTAVDQTKELTVIGAGKAAAAGLSVEWRVGDAADTRLPSGAYAAVVSNMGLIFVEPTSQVAEAARLLRPAGRLAFSSWVRDDDNPFFTPVEAVFGARPKAEFSPEEWGDPDTIHARLDHHFDDITIQHNTLTWEFASLDAALHFVRAESPMHVATFGRADAHQREALVAAFESAFRAHVDAHGAVTFHAPYVVVSATRRE